MLFARSKQAIVLPLDGAALVSAAILRHEVNGLRRDLLCSDRQITFVFTVFIVNNDRHLPCAYGRNSIFNASE